MFARSTLFVLLLFGLLTGCASTPAPPAAGPAEQTAAPDFHDLETRFGARLGVYALDTGSGKEIAYHAEDRFAYASTIKALAVGALLLQGADLDKRLTYTQADIVSHSPVTGPRVNTGVTVREAAEAALQQSDNTAGNLLFRELGGPAGLANALRSIGDTTTHPDRWETSLNEAAPGDIRDTSTPRALATSLRAFALGDALPADKRDLLVDLMRHNTTGSGLIAAGLPEGWTSADKTGSAGYGTRNDIAVVWPPSSAPVVLAVLSTRDTKDATYDDKLIAEATARAVTALR
ncbi:beta-lactamase class A [Amycolatopsis sacchari]|uniref:Beta-lactamase n=1 Tax=Amycolatopsis sacchari TaxID=115433 RepID=A0A1I3Q359_9PSEU|nr:class A beta-lactamase [Amycolatopsis sacchari]SFJ28644.1 beta-lactamase class A [Amycolatopsis sacchari]